MESDFATEMDVMEENLEFVPGFLCEEYNFSELGLWMKYVGMLISLWLFLFQLFLFASQPKEFFLYGLKRLEQRSVELRGEYVE
jgi:hypothetical protein